MELNWIDIVDFASKYGISQSTIRRRIRGGSIDYRMEKGKYLLRDMPENFNQAPLYTRIARQQSVRGQEAGSAYELSKLQEENRQLRGQIEELQTLVKVLEDQLQNK